MEQPLSISQEREPTIKKFTINKGQALIVISSNISSNNDWEQEANRRDKDAFYGLLTNMGFTVKVLDYSEHSQGRKSHNRSFKEAVETTIYDWSSNKGGILTNADCLIVVFLTHGGLDEENAEFVVVGTDNIYVEWIYERFSNKQCTAMSGKPKLFFLRYCRGEKLDFTPTTDDRRIQSDAKKFDYLDMSEYFIAHSQFKGYVAFLKAEGSNFVKYIVEVFNEMIPLDIELQHLMLEVHGRIQQQNDVGSLITEVEKGRHEKKMGIFKEVPCFMASMTMEIYFNLNKQPPAISRAEPSFPKEIKINKGQALIVVSPNTSNISSNNESEKKGNRKDRDAFYGLLTNMGFTVKVLDYSEYFQGRNRPNKPFKEAVETTINDWSSNEGGILTNADCLIVVFLTQGGLDEKKAEFVVVGTDNIYIEWIYERFSNKQCIPLSGKPKLFFLRYLRGNKMDLGSANVERIQSDATRHVEADMTEYFIAYPPVAEVLTAEGSSFVNNIAEVFKANEELHHLMLKVYSNIIGPSNAGSIIERKVIQEPPLLSSITNKVYLKDNVH